MVAAAAAVSLVILGVVATCSPAWAELAVAVAGQEETVFSHARDACRAEDIPDAPAHAFRDASGQVHLFATHYINYASVGPDLNRVKRDCRVVYQGRGDDDPAHFDDRAWLVAFWTDDGRSVYAIVHDEFQGRLRPSLCPSHDAKCDYTSLTAAVSTDGGLHFHRQGQGQGQGIVAAPPARYSAEIGHPVGYGGSSSLLKRGNYYYTFTGAAPVANQQRGDCLLRNDNLAHPEGWLAWGDGGFTVRLENAYLPGSASGQSCTAIDPTHLRSDVLSLVQHRPTGRYIALMSIEAGPRPGFYTSLSDDLFHWSEPKMLIENYTAAAHECRSREARAYPALLDPSSPSRNFETVGDKAYLYFTRFNMHGCSAGLDRDLVRVPVAISDRP